MELQVEERGDGIGCVRLAGRLDAPGADRIGVRFNAAVAAPGRPVLVDLGGLDFVGSMGLRLLIAAARALAAKGARMVMFGARDAVRSVLDEAAIGQIIAIAETEDEAVRALSV